MLRRSFKLDIHQATVETCTQLLMLLSSALYVSRGSDVIAGSLCA